VAHLAVAPLLVDIGRSLREAFFMFWATLWALVLGFTISGVVQAFVSKDRMQTRLGDHRPGTVARASFFGMVSSSCSYAASAMSKSLFAKGADFVAAMAFMIASTNLVVELGIVLLVLLGWQFMAAEFVGGPIMIALLALTGGLVFTGSLLTAARSRLVERRAAGHDHSAMATVSEERQEELEESELADKLRSPAAWSDASSYAVADVTMLRKELVIGYLVAGFLAVVVPTSAWNALFLQGHGVWTTIENAMVGPLIAVISWVCSIGNVPLAAALWSGGISFGGVISFIFADLIAMPLILIYIKFYGWRLTARLVGLFYVLMVIAGLATQMIFAAAGLIPTSRPITIAPAHFEWNYTTFLNIIFLLVAAAVFWMAKHRSRFGGGVGYAIDPVCGMQVRSADAPATAVHEGITHYFCADRCRERFIADPGRFLRASDEPEPSQDPSGSDTLIDPVCGMAVDAASAAATREIDGMQYLFCNDSCALRFDDEPERFTGPCVVHEPMAAVAPIALSLGVTARVAQRSVDPVCGMSVDPDLAPDRRRYGDELVVFCSSHCAERFDDEPRAFLGGAKEQSPG